MKSLSLMHFEYLLFNFNFFFIAFFFFFFFSLLLFSDWQLVCKYAAAISALVSERVWVAQGWVWKDSRIGLVIGIGIKYKTVTVRKRQPEKNAELGACSLQI